MVENETSLFKQNSKYQLTKIFASAAEFRFIDVKAYILVYSLRFKNDTKFINW